MYERGDYVKTTETGLREELPEGFWDDAVMEFPPGFWEEAESFEQGKPQPTSVHLKLDPEVFNYFKSQGKGHLTRMQNVLRAYVKAHQQRGG